MAFSSFTSSRSRRLLPLLLAPAVFLLVFGSAGHIPSGTAPPPQKMVPGDNAPVSWHRVDQLVRDQKLRAASELVESYLDRARQEGDTETWTRAMVEEARLKTALHGYEDAVRFLQKTPWPGDAFSRTILDLVYARALTDYINAYSWEIRRRERLENPSRADLKRWDLESLVAEANRAFFDAWQQRGQWDGRPIGDASRYIVPNDYPPRIRGTFRDAVSYLWTELLANSSLWSPAQSNGVYALDLDALLAGRPGTTRLDDPAAHPLVKIAAVLGDLERWHEAAGRHEAALEATLERVRRLDAAFTQSQDQLHIRQYLERRLARFDRSFPWWSTGQAELAELIRREPAPDALVRARKVALAGRNRHPESPGGKRCAAIVASIEAPACTVSCMASDGAGKRSIQITHRNLGRLHFRAWWYDLEARTGTAREANLLMSSRDADALIHGRPADVSWSVDLPPTPDYRSHVTYAVPPLHRKGAWLILASMREDFSWGANLLQAQSFILSDLVLVTRTLGTRYEITARSGATGAPVADVRLALYRFDWRKGYRLVQRLESAADGRASLDAGGWKRQAHILVARHGDDLAVLTSPLYPLSESRQHPRAAALLYTDRSVYRPGQTLHWKVVAYEGNADRTKLTTLEGAALTVVLKDANGEEVARRTLSADAFGAGAGEFEIPTGRLLGRWTLSCSLGGSASVRVEEYKRPTFEVEIQDPGTPLRLNRAAALRGQARYYFGLPLAEGSFRWRVTREPVYPRWWSWWWPIPQGQPQVIAAGSGKLDTEGRLECRFTPAADEREASKPGLTYRYKLSVDVTDEGGETRSASRVFRLGFVAVEARLDDPPGFLRAGSATTLTILRSDLDGKPAPGTGRWELRRLMEPERPALPADLPAGSPGRHDDGAYHTPGDALRPRWEGSYDPGAVLARWKAGERVGAGSLEHAGGGRARLELPALEPGAYRLIYTTKDAFGATFTLGKDLVAAGHGPLPVELAAILAVERPSVPVGGTARVLVGSALSRQDLVLEIFQGGRRIERRTLRSGAGDAVMEIPIGAEERGGLGLALTLLRDHQMIRRTARIAVPWDDRELKLGFTTFRDRLRPGSRETFTVAVKRHDGKPLGAGAAELLAYMYDRSLDIFAPHTPPDPLALYPDRSSVGPASSNLGASQSVWSRHALPPLPSFPRFRGDRLISISGYGIGGPGRRGGPPVLMVEEGVRAMAMPAPGAANKAKAEVSDKLAGTAHAPSAPAPAETAELRTNFAETAFWEPGLLLGAGGTASIVFTVPDSVTEWNVWVHAITKDLRSGSLHRTTRSVKELMVRPYLPRFLREGDRASLKVAVNDAGEEPLTGTVDLEIVDPETGEDLRSAFGLDATSTESVPFSVKPGGGTTLSFSITTPLRIGTVAFRVTARAGDFADGEQRPLPVLPGRMHLVQSRFVTLRGGERRTLSFPEMARSDDPTRIDDQLVVTVDAQLFYSVLNALPYLIDYPYECTEQTLNRYLSTAIVTSLFDRYPAVAEMARSMASRKTRYPAWDANDPNRRMELVETPWLVASRGGGEAASELIRVLDPKVAAAQKRASLAKLKKAQTSDGGFPWFPGGPPSPHMTLYILSGFARGLEFGVLPPRDVVVRAWRYVHRHYLDDMVRADMKKDCCWEGITFLSYVLSSYPDESWTGGIFSAEDRRRMLDFSFRHWREHSPMLKGYLALTLKRAGRAADARLVWDSVMDSAKTDRDLGTYWAPEDRSWLWYNDTTETQAFALRVLAELRPADPRREGLVQWLMLHKKLNHWKSTRATAEALYAMAWYLKQEHALAVREEVRVAAGPVEKTFVFEPDRYTGAGNRLVIPGPEIDPKTMSRVEVAKKGKGLAFATATWHFSTEKLPEAGDGDLFAVHRSYFRRINDGTRWVLEPLEDGARLAVGDQVEVQLSIRARHAAEYVHLRDPRGAGFEPESLHSRWRWDLGIAYYEEVRDSGTDFFFERLPTGEYTLKYRLRATMAGVFRAAPATLQSMYAPEFAAYSAGTRLEVRGN